MAKITRHGGASDATLPQPEPAAADAAVPEPVKAPEPAPGLVEEPLDVTRDLAGEPAPVEETSEGAEPGPDSGTAEPEAAEAPREQEPDYETWTVEQLKEQLAVRGLPKSGKRDDLVLRLLEDDDTRTAQAETATE
ncbi:SAP domain-containing protein [Streptomyces alboflavus]|uniref:SAP domain-containing protein n=1 Tax=Streptomyces alboflavus TaxID=67267 RepID=UPI000A3E12D1|nr:SAP domain-containing protein [Streptomyces alboflavus]